MKCLNNFNCLIGTRTNFAFENRVQSRLKWKISSLLSVTLLVLQIGQSYLIRMSCEKNYDFWRVSVLNGKLYATFEFHFSRDTMSEKWNNKVIRSRREWHHIYSPYQRNLNRVKRVLHVFFSSTRFFKNNVKEWKRPPRVVFTQNKGNKPVLCKVNMFMSWQMCKNIMMYF